MGASAARRGKLAIALAAHLAAFVGCTGGERSDAGRPRADQLAAGVGAAAPESTAGGGDEGWDAIARRARGFGGAYLDEDQHLVVLTIDPSQRVDAEREVRAVLGGAVGPGATVFRSADYEYAQLEAWRGLLRRVPFRASISLCVDPRTNRIRVGTSGAHSEIEAALKEQGIPRKAVVIEQFRSFIPAVGAGSPERNPRAPAPSP
jgi:hypothetical protein